MAHGLKSPSLEMRLNKFEPLLPLVLGIHGTTLLLFRGGAPWQWAAVLGTGLLGIWSLSGWRNIKQAVLLRVTVIFIVTWLLLLTTGGVGSFFLLWYFVLISIYPFLLAKRPAIVLLIGIPLSYLLLLPISSQPIPLIVVLSRVFLLAFIGGLTRVLASTMHRYLAERRRKEEDLRHQAVLLNSISDAVITTDLEFVIQSWNSAAEALYGWRAEEVLGKPIAEVVPTSYPTTQTEMVLAQFQAEGMWQGEAIQQHKDGHDICVLASVTMVRDESGRPMSVLAINRDITARKQAEEALQKSNDRLSLAIGVTGLGIYEHAVPLDGNTYHSPRWAEIIGYEVAELPPPAERLEWVLEQVHPDDLSTLEAAYTDFIEGRTESYHVEIRLKHKSGAWVWVSGYSEAMERDECGQVIRILGVMQDITGRKQAEEALQRSEQVLQLFVENAPAAIAMFDREMRYIAASRRYLIDYGLGDQDVVGRSHYEIFPEISEDWKEMHQRCLAGATESADEDPFPRADGRLDWVHWEIRPWHEHTGEIGGIMLFSEVITERIEVQEALRQREAHYRSLFEYVPDGILIADLESYYLDANPAMCDMLGYTREELIGMHGSDIVAPQETQRIEPALNEIKTTSDYAEVWQFRRKDGSVFPAEVRVTTMPDGNLLAMVHDITERQQAEQALRESEEKFSTAFQASPLALGIATLDGKFVDVNRAFCDLVGYSREEIIGKTATDLELIGDQDREKLVAAIQSAGGSVSNAEIQFRVRDGSLRTILYSLEQISFHGAPHRLAAGVDITRRKQAEEALRESETRFRATFEQAAVGVAHVKPDGSWFRVNQKLCDIVGYAREELFDLTYQDMTHPDDLEADLEYMRQILAGQIQTYSMEKRYFRKDGSIVWINLTVSLVRKPSGEPDYSIAVIQDITEAKRMEEQYYQAQKMEAVGQLTAGIAHDFNNLLLVMNGFAELMQLQLAPDDPHRESLDKILHAGQRAADLVRQLLIFSRKQVIELQRLNLNTIVANMDKMLRRIIGEDIKLKTNLSPDLGQVKVDPTQIEQIIVNLAVNARDAMPEGGRLTIETTNVLLDDDYVAHHLEAQPGNHILLAVSDTGYGMSEEVQAHMFEPFFTTKEQGKGTGLGLATVYGIVKQNGGNIWVYSEPGTGTTFKIYLPHVQEGMAASSQPELEATLLSGNETILLVEDDVEVRNLVRRVLQSQGYTLLEATEGKEALQLATDHAGSIHLLLTDVIMPGMNGRQLADELAQVRPGLKALFMSGYTDDAIAHHGVLDPGVNLLQKPFGSTTLARKVRSVLDS